MRLVSVITPSIYIFSDSWTQDSFRFACLLFVFFFIGLSGILGLACVSNFDLLCVSLECFLFTPPVFMSSSPHLPCIFFVSPAVLPASSQANHSQLALMSTHLFPISLLVLLVFRAWFSVQSLFNPQCRFVKFALVVIVFD